MNVMPQILTLEAVLFEFAQRSKSPKDLKKAELGEVTQVETPFRIGQAGVDLWVEEVHGRCVTSSKRGGNGAGHDGDNIREHLLSDEVILTRSSLRISQKFQ